MQSGIKKQINNDLKDITYSASMSSWAEEPWLQKPAIQREFYLFILIHLLYIYPLPC